MKLIIVEPCNIRGREFRPGKEYRRLQDHEPLASDGVTGDEWQQLTSGPRPNATIVPLDEA